MRAQTKPRTTQVSTPARRVSHQRGIPGVNDVNVLVLAILGASVYAGFETESVGLATLGLAVAMGIHMVQQAR